MCHAHGKPGYAVLFMITAQVDLVILFHPYKDSFNRKVHCGIHLDPHPLDSVVLQMHIILVYSYISYLCMYMISLSKC